MTRPKRDRAAARKWGLSVIWLWAGAEQPALTAVPSQVPQVSLTVIHVEAGAYLNVGGTFIDPRAIPVQEAAPPAGKRQVAHGEEMIAEAVRRAAQR